MAGLPADQLNEFHKNLVDETFKNFVVRQLKSVFKEDFKLIENDLQELLKYTTLREIKARASMLIISRKKID